VIAHEDNGKKCEGDKVDNVDRVLCRHLVGGLEKIWFVDCWL
jgi:hypothetical protein